MVRIARQRIIYGVSSSFSEQPSRARSSSVDTWRGCPARNVLMRSFSCPLPYSFALFSPPSRLHRTTGPTCATGLIYATFLSLSLLRSVHFAASALLMASYARSRSCFSFSGPPRRFVDSSFSTGLILLTRSTKFLAPYPFPLASSFCLFLHSLAVPAGKNRELRPIGKIKQTSGTSGVPSRESVRFSLRQARTN